MGRKRAIAISISSTSSDDDERERASVSGASSRRGGCKRAKGATRGRSGARSTSARPAMAGEVSFENLSIDFSECLPRLHAFPSGSRKVELQELWVDKYKPCSRADLAVHKKKVEQIKNWLEGRLAMSKDLVGSNVLVITGPSGSGKSAVVHVIASELGAKLCEWKTPTPTLWTEHLHNSYSGIRYMSKLDEFELFVEQARKYRLLPSSEMSTREPNIFLIDDLPVANGRISYERLRKSLDVLVRTTPVPTVLLITEFAKHDARDNMQLREGLEMFLERSGACKVSFNLITINSIKKALLRICKAEKCEVSEEWVTLIAKASGGDLRHAITSLQYFCLGSTGTQILPQSTGSSHAHDVDLPPLAVHVDEPTCNIYLHFGRDETLSFFHALGKFLHNKREAEYGVEDHPILLKEQYSRYPSKLKDPEIAISQAHGQARSITDFLHENVLDFISNEDMQDGWTVASYLSDADCLLKGTNATMPHATTWRYDPEHVSQHVAASVAVRGVLFGNSRPLSSRWHSMRTPTLWQVDQSSRINRNGLVMERFRCSCSLTSTCISVIATEYRPAIRWLGSRVFDNAEDAEQSRGGSGCNSNDSNSSLASNPKGEGFPELSEDDEIEEW